MKMFFRKLFQSINCDNHSVLENQLREMSPELHCFFYEYDMIMQWTDMKTDHKNVFCAQRFVLLLKQFKSRIFSACIFKPYSRAP